MMPPPDPSGLPLSRGTQRDGADGNRHHIPALVITISLFFLWGVANNLNDILIAQFRKAFVLTDFGTSFVQQVFYFGYFVFAVPASLVLRRFGYKPAILIGLLLYGTGATLFYPAANASAYQIFLAALFVIAAGLAFLETCASPLIADLGNPATTARRLNWAQAANPVGAITGILIGRNFILSGIEHDAQQLSAMSAPVRTAFYRTEIQAVVAPYLWLAVIVFGFAAAVLVVRFPDGRVPREHHVPGARFRDIIHHRRLLGAVVAQFFYVGAQVGLWSYTIRYAQANAGFGERAGADALFVSLLLFAAGRFAGSVLMTRVSPTILLVLFASVSLFLALVAGIIGGTLGLGALVAASFFLSIQFPTIFALGINGLGALRHAGASLIVMAIIGGAALTAVMGAVSDIAGITRAMLVPAAGFGVVIVFALSALRTPTISQDTTP